MEGRLVETEEDFGEVYGPIFTDADGPLSTLWAIYEEACNEDDERTRWGEVEPLDADELAEQWPSIAEWQDIVQTALARLDDDAMAAHLTRMVNHFVASIQEGLGMFDMIAERQPQLAEQMVDAKRRAIEAVTEVLTKGEGFNP